MTEYRTYVGLDVHKDSIAVAGQEEPDYRGKIGNERRSLRRLINRLSPHGDC